MSRGTSRHQALEMLGEVYREHFGFVWALLRRLGVHDRDLEDVAQDVFVVVHRRLPQFEGRASIRTWLYAIAVRVAANYRRKRRPDPEAGDSMTSRLVAPSSSSPEEHVVRSEAAVLLDQLLGRMDDKKRAVFVLSEIEGLSAPEIARIVGTNPRTVHSRLRAARSRFETDLARVHARDAGDSMNARWLQHAASGHNPPKGADKRVWAALVLQLPELGGAAGAGGAGALGWAHAVKAIAVSAGLGLATIGGVYVAATPLRADDSPPAASDEVKHSAIADAKPEPVERPIPKASPVEAAPPELVAIVPEPPPAQRPVARESKPPEPVAEPDALSAELDLVSKTRRALAAGDHEAVLKWSKAHAEQFPEGEFRRERDRSRVAALCALDRASEAATLASETGVPSACDAG